MGDAICKNAFSWNEWHASGRFGIKWKVGAMRIIDNHTYFHAIKE